MEWLILELKYDGSAWLPMESGVIYANTTGSVNSLCVLGSNLFVGGRFEAVGTIPSNNIAVWNETPTGVIGIANLPQEFKLNQTTPILSILQQVSALVYLKSHLLLCGFTIYWVGK
ncbi:MAG: hypothetical protein IPL53_00130 [Ignavibacteria bacterium]|nr:hypothetical protein [Ignavibacteria bacterium]